MVAAAFKASITYRNMRTNERKTIPYTVSDVTGAFWLSPSGTGAQSIGTDDYEIVDVILTAAGTDTSQTEIFVNGVNTGVKIFHALNLATTINRQAQSMRLGIKAGNIVEYKQLT